MAKWMRPLCSIVPITTSDLSRRQPFKKKPGALELYLDLLMVLSSPKEGRFTLWVRGRRSRRNNFRHRELFQRTCESRCWAGATGGISKRTSRHFSSYVSHVGMMELQKIFHKTVTLDQFLSYTTASFLQSSDYCNDFGINPMFQLQKSGSVNHLIRMPFVDLCETLFVPDTVFTSQAVMLHRSLLRSERPGHTCFVVILGLCRVYSARAKYETETCFETIHRFESLVSIILHPSMEGAFWGPTL